jgi:peptidoglycan/xylan/chitin deacetylase (PgdA/CDA1 family)
MARGTRLLAHVALVLGLLTGCGVAPSAPGSLGPSEATPAGATPTEAAATSSATATPRVTPSASTSVAATANATPTPVHSSVVHSVAPGESLSLIAARYSTTWQSIVYWNRDRYVSLDPGSAGYDPNAIGIGWQLVVWPGVVVSYDAPLPKPTPAPTPIPPPPPATPSQLVSHGARGTSMVALTFDMGGRTDPAVDIVSWLRDNGVAATIFLTGSSIDTTQAARDVIAIVNANPGQFDLGNHSYSHPDMTALTAGEVRAEIAAAERAIASYATQPTRPLFRPPYGASDAEMLAGAGAAGYRWSVMWDVDTIDWKPIADGGPTAAQMTAKVVGMATGGSIVLMHLGGYETLDALPGIVNGLRERGLEPVTLDELLGG